MSALPAFESFGAPRDIRCLLAHRRVLLFGATPAAAEPMRFLAAHDVPVAGFLDNSPEKQGGTFAGLPVHAPADLGRLLDGETAIVIAAAWQSEIAHQLVDDLGVPEGVVFPYVSAMFQGHFGAAALLPARGDLDWLMNTVADRESRDYLARLVAFRWRMDARALARNPMIDGPYSYAVAELGPRPGDRIVDCGAFDGDTARLFLERLDGNCRITALEATGRNFRALENWIASAGVTDRVAAVHCAVGAEDGEAIIVSDGEDGSADPRATARRCGSGETVTMRPLDGLIDDGADYIKVDVEGFELDVLAGAAATIRRHRPDLALASYHAPAHLWQVARAVRAFDPRYRLFLGHHPAAAYECELFCTARAGIEAAA
ncbi:FkbM family methyltransferase [Oceanibacterium hippocampi]|nr:FkbM family methyltransferase [Oceanibacterium hippocampi]